jgi:hypothetical protein
MRSKEDEIAPLSRYRFPQTGNASRPIKQLREPVEILFVKNTNDEAALVSARSWVLLYRSSPPLAVEARGGKYFGTFLFPLRRAGLQTTPHL